MSGELFAEEVGPWFQIFGKMSKLREWSTGQELNIEALARGRMQSKGRPFCLAVN
jgi:hypothetical protein